jgi:YggT family protein
MNGDARAIIVDFVQVSTYVLTIAIFVRALMSWLRPNEGSGFSRVLYDVTEPILSRIRRLLPPAGGIDFSPLVALLLLTAIRYIVLSAI